MGKRKKGKGKGRKQAMTRRQSVRPGGDSGEVGPKSEGPTSELPPSSTGQGSPSSKDEDVGSMSSPEDGVRSESSTSEGASDGGARDQTDEPKDADDAPSRLQGGSGAGGGGEPPDDEEAGIKPHPDGASWALPLIELDRRWTWLETRVMFVCLVTLTVLLSLFFSIRGMKEPLEAQVAAGTVFRAAFGAAVLGGLTWRLSRDRLEIRQRSIATTVAVVVACLLAKVWRGVGISYFEVLSDWIQEGSVFTLFGGLVGLSTRVTMLVALIGASLAASSGTHINIDVVLRLIPKQFRRTLAVTTSLATALVCLVSSWGFFDHIAISEFGAKLDAPAGDKVAHVADKLGDQFFTLRKQVSLDLKAIPSVATGTRWNAPERMNGERWNAWLEDAGFVERFGDKVTSIQAPASAANDPWQPFVQIPGEETRGALKKGFDLLWPFGFLMIALRFVLRALLIASKHIDVHVEGEGDDESTGPSAAEVVA